MSGPNTNSNGYGAEHKQIRRQWAVRMRTEEVRCARCGLPIVEGEPWDLGHTADRAGYTGPEHATCNRKDGSARGIEALRAMRLASGAQFRTSRDW